MLQFHPPGMGEQVIDTTLGKLVGYGAASEPWHVPPPSAQPLLFLHNFGGGASAYEWSRVYPAFLDRYRVMAVDLLGWGQSAHPERDYQVDDYLITLTDWIEQTCTQPAIAVASSLTGAITIRLAIQRPDLFKALFLTCPSGFADFGQDAGRRLPLAVINLPLLDQVIYSVGAMNEAAVRNFLENFLFHDRDRLSPELVQAYLESATQPNAQYAALAFLRGDLYFDLANYLPLLTVPTAIAWGEEAQFTPIALGQRLAALNPGAVRSWFAIAGAGVLPQLEQPAQVIAALHQFLRDCDRS